MNGLPHVDASARDGADLRERHGFQWLLDVSPGAGEAIRERLDRYPEYRRWLQQFNPEILRAVE